MAGGPRPPPRSVTTTVLDTTVVRVAGVGSKCSTCPHPSNCQLQVWAFWSRKPVSAPDADPGQLRRQGNGAILTSSNAAWVAVTLALRPFTTTRMRQPAEQWQPTDLDGRVYNTYYPARPPPMRVRRVSRSGLRGRLDAHRRPATLLLVVQMQDAAINNSNTSSYGDGW